MTLSRTGFPGTGTLAAGMLLVAGLGFGTAGVAADINNGGRLYSLHCAGCHGATGVPTMVGAPDFKRSQVLMRPDAQLALSLKRGRGAMPAYLGIMNERELLDVVAYLRTLN